MRQEVADEFATLVDMGFDAERSLDALGRVDKRIRDPGERLALATERVLRSQ